MIELLSKIVTAHGGAERWEAASHLTATVSSGGTFWGSVGLIETGEPYDATVWLHEQRAIARPTRGGSTCEFEADRVSLRRGDGMLVAETWNSRSRYEATRLVPWSPLHRAFFNGYALWTCLTMPFLLAMPGVELSEREPWHEGSETWRVIRARFPASMVTMGPIQDFFFGQDLLLRRHDYSLGSAGDFHCAELVASYLEAGGIRVPGHRRAYRRGPDGRPRAAPVTISLDVDHLSFTQTGGGERPARTGIAA